MEADPVPLIEAKVIFTPVPEVVRPPPGVHAVEAFGQVVQKPDEKAAEAITPVPSVVTLLRKGGVEQSVPVYVRVPLVTAVHHRIRSFQHDGRANVSRAKQLHVGRISCYLDPMDAVLALNEDESNSEAGVIELEVLANPQ